MSKSCCWRNPEFECSGFRFARSTWLWLALALALAARATTGRGRSGGRHSAATAQRASVGARGVGSAVRTAHLSIMTADKGIHGSSVRIGQAGIMSCKSHDAPIAQKPPLGHAVCYLSRRHAATATRTGSSSLLAAELCDVCTVMVCSRQGMTGRDGIAPPACRALPH